MGLGQLQIHVERRAVDINGSLRGSVFLCLEKDFLQTCTVALELRGSENVSLRSGDYTYSRWRTVLAAVPVLEVHLEQGLAAGVHQFAFDHLLSSSSVCSASMEVPGGTCSYSLVAALTGSKLACTETVVVTHSPKAVVRRRPVQEREITRCCSSQGQVTMCVDYPSVLHNTQSGTLEVKVTCESSQLRPKLLTAVVKQLRVARASIATTASTSKSMTQPVRAQPTFGMDASGNECFTFAGILVPRFENTRCDSVVREQGGLIDASSELHVCISFPGCSSSMKLQLPLLCQSCAPYPQPFAPHPKAGSLLWSLKQEAKIKAKSARRESDGSVFSRALAVAEVLGDDRVCVLLSQARMDALGAVDGDQFAFQSRATVVLPVFASRAVKAPDTAAGFTTGAMALLCLQRGMTVTMRSAQDNDAPAPANKLFLMWRGRGLTSIDCTTAELVRCTAADSAVANTDAADTGDFADSMQRMLQRVRPHQKCTEAWQHYCATQRTRGEEVTVYQEQVLPHPDGSGCAVVFSVEDLPAETADADEGGEHDDEAADKPDYSVRGAAVVSPAVRTACYVLLVMSRVPIPVEVGPLEDLVVKLTVVDADSE